jgi:predicted RND superfamily exporter protein
MRPLKDVLLGWVFRVGRYHAWWVLFIFLLLSGGGIYFALHVPIRSSALDLLPRNDPLIEEYKENEQYFAQADYVGLLLTLSGDVPESPDEREAKLLSAAKVIKESLDQDPEFVAVTYLQELSADIPEQYLQLFELDRTQLTRIEDSVELARGTIGTEQAVLLSHQTLGGIYANIAAQFSDALQQGTTAHSTRGCCRRSPGWTASLRSPRRYRR